jgi:two-component system, response regulator
METGKILLVEDDSRDVELTIAALEQHHLANEVVVARDGVEAVDYFYARGKFAGRTGPLPVVVLLDLKMPRMDGMEVLRILKRDPEVRSVPIVVLTSSREEQDIIKSYDLGVNAYVVKPVDFDGFMKVVEDLGLFWVLINQPPPKSAAAGS